MTIYSPHIVKWVSLYVIPQEHKVRAALHRLGITDNDIDDLIQDAYCRLAALKSVDHIHRPGAYFMQIVKNAWRDNLRRAKIVRIEDFAEAETAMIIEDTSTVEASVFAREQLQLVETLLNNLPERCRTIFTWKRIEGMPQREIAERLGVSEKIVENDVQKALRIIQRELRGTEADDQEEQKFGNQRQKIG